jgi:hypothetical protein
MSYEGLIEEEEEEVKPKFVSKGYNAAEKIRPRRKE